MIKQVKFCFISNSYLLFKLTFKTINLINKPERLGIHEHVGLTYWQISIHNTYTCRLYICRDLFYFLYMHERKLNFLMKFFESVTKFFSVRNEQDIHKTTFFIYISLSSMFYNCKNMFSTHTRIY